MKPLVRVVPVGTCWGLRVLRTGDLLPDPYEDRLHADAAAALINGQSDDEDDGEEQAA